MLVTASRSIGAMSSALRPGTVTSVAFEGMRVVVESLNSVSSCQGCACVPGRACALGGDGTSAPETICIETALAFESPAVRYLPANVAQVGDVVLAAASRRQNATVIVVT